MPKSFVDLDKRLNLLFLLVLFSLWQLSSTVAFAKDGQNSNIETCKKKETADLPNFHQVHPYLYRGGEPSEVGLKKLSDRGIKTIIDLRAKGARTSKEKALAQTLGMDYINLPMSDKAPTQSQVETFLAAVKEGREKDRPVFLHCAHGSDRTGCLIGIYRVSEDGYTYKEAYKEMRRYYFGPQFKELSGAVKARANN